MTITVRVEIQQMPSGVHFTAAYALYVGDNPLFEWHSTGRTYSTAFEAQDSASTAAVALLDELRQASVEFRTSSRG